MNITIEVGGPLAEAINRLADALVSAKQTDTIIEKASTKAKAKKEATPAPEALVEAAPEQHASTASTETAVPTGTAEAAAPNRDDAKKAVLAIAKEKGHDAAAGLLAKFGATKISEVKDADIAAIIEAAKAL